MFKSLAVFFSATATAGAIVVAVVLGLQSHPTTAHPVADGDGDPGSSQTTTTPPPPPESPLGGGHGWID